MSFAIKELSGLLAGQQRVAGVVTGFSGEFVVVATARGAVQARAAGTVVRGDRVTITGGWCEKAPVADAIYPV